MTTAVVMQNAKHPPYWTGETVGLPDAQAAALIASGDAVLATVQPTGSAPTSIVDKADDLMHRLGSQPFFRTTLT